MQRIVPFLMSKPLQWLVLASLVPVYAGTVYTIYRRETKVSLIFLGALLALAVLGMLLQLARTAREREEAARKEAGEKSRLALVAEYTTNAIILLDAKGIIEWVNETFLQLSGYQNEEILGKPITSLWGEETDAAAKRSCQEALRMGKSAKIEMLRYGKKGFTYWVQSQMRPIRNEEELTHFLLVESEITDFKLYENALIKARQAAESAAQAKGEFLAMMSHEIRTPLNAVLGYVSMLESTNLDSVQRKYLKTVYSSGTVLLHLLDDILDFSRMEAGTLSAESQAFDPEQILLEILPLYEGDAKSKGLQLRMFCNASVPDKVEADGRRLRQILVNLLGNAIKFTKEGEVSVTIDAKPQGADDFLLVFVVKDTGIGIPQERFEEIFQPFFQVDSSSARSFGGAGLGLAITRRFAHLMNGQIRVESQVGEGSTFTLSFPVRKAKISSPPAEETVWKPTDAIRLKILVAEDNLVNRKLIQRMLVKLGHHPTLVSDGSECISAAMEGIYDLILMDVQMPTIDGLEAARRLRQNGIKTPIIAVTAHVMSEDVKKCFEAGMDGYLSKPLTSQLLQQTILKFVSKNECV